MLTPDLLYRHPLFNLADPNQISTWVASARLRQLKIGELLCREHEKAHSLFIVKSGRVRVLRKSEDDRELTVGTCRAGELFGDYSLLAPHRCAATCRVSADSEIWCLPLPPVLSLVRATHGKVSLRPLLKLQYLVRFLRNECYLGFMSGGAFLPLLEACEELTFEAGQTIQAETLYSDSMFLIVEGTACRDMPCNELTAMTSSAGDLFGVESVANRIVPCMIAQTIVVCWRIPGACVFDKGEANGAEQSLSHAQRAASLHFPFVKQSSATECGPASLAMVSAFHRMPVSMETIRQVVKLGHRGTSLAELLRISEFAGFSARAVRISDSHLTGATLPAIAHLHGSHYVVIYAADRHSVVVGDPAIGVIQQTRRDLSAIWDGTLLLLQPPAGR